MTITEAPPTIFDWWAGIVLPVVNGLLSLGVGLLSLLAAAVSVLIAILATNAARKANNIALEAIQAGQRRDRNERAQRLKPRILRGVSIVGRRRHLGAQLYQRCLEPDLRL